MTQSDGTKLIKLGLRLYTIGIGVQEAFVVMFIALAIRFHWKMLNGFGNVERGDGWKKLLYTTYATLILITVCLFSLLTCYTHYFVFTMLISLSRSVLSTGCVNSQA